MPDDRKRMPLLWKIGLLIAICLVLGIVLNCLLIGYVDNDGQETGWKDILANLSGLFLCTSVLIFLICYKYWRWQKIKQSLDIQKANKLKMKHLITGIASGVVVLLLVIFRIIVVLFIPLQPSEWTLESISFLGLVMLGAPLLLVSILSFVWLLLIRMEFGKSDCEAIDPSLISRKRHYFYVLIFSLTAWLFTAETIGAFIPYYIERGICQCKFHDQYYNISSLVFGAGGIICGIIFSFPLHRWGLVSVAKPEDKGVKLSGMAAHGKTLLGWRGLVALAVIAAIYLSCEYMFRDITKEHKLWGSDATPLLCAASRGEMETVANELGKGEDVNVKGWFGVTPLHGSAYHGRLEVVKYLISKGADVNAKSDLKLTPLHSAAEKGHVETASLLLEKGANIDATDYAGATPLMRAINNNHKVFVEFLVDKGAGVNSNSKLSSSPLHRAIGTCHKDILKLLIEKGADINAKDPNGRTPLDWALEINEKETADLLRANGAKTGKELGKQKK
ncbi:MAG: hypothetical protein E3J72_10770 [Planctomycetota bacterium]|nr:MAG: hypothetical protein E3J72_10770 [Planctomycetota bacterium]